MADRRQHSMVLLPGGGGELRTATPWQPPVVSHRAMHAARLAVDWGWLSIWVAP